MELSDYRLNAAVRSILFRHWVDLQRLTFGSFRGTIRMKGELCFLGTNNLATLGQIEAIESEIKSLNGVRRVYFELSNWYKSEQGRWTSARSRAAQQSGAGAQAAASSSAQGDAATDSKKVDGS